MPGHSLSGFRAEQRAAFHVVVHLAVMLRLRGADAAAEDVPRAEVAGSFEPRGSDELGERTHRFFW